MSVTTRFAPAPTGLLHLGNLRTALLNWLQARHCGGRFLLRFEDTDDTRNQQQFIDAIMDDLRWLGLEWEGAPRFQSAHAEAHRQALQQLADQKLAYRCFCSEQQLQMNKKLAVSRGLPPRYSGRCRSLDADEAAERARNEPFVWRLAIHDGNSDEKICVPDRLRGDVIFSRRDLDDPVVVRSNGRFTFVLPNAIDDALDGVTHVLRGDDHLTNSAWQVWLLQHLGYPVPCYFHHGLLLNGEGRKLSKRDGATPLRQLRHEGLLADALLQAMARIGHPNIDESIHSIAELSRQFQADALSTSAVRWSDDAMWRWHEKLLHNLPAEQLATLIAPHLPECDAPTRTRLAALIAHNLSRAEDATRFARLIDPSAPLTADAETVTRQAGTGFFHLARALWRDENIREWKAWTDELKSRSSARGRALFMPLRAALTGCCHGPEMATVLDFLGYDGVLARLDPLAG